MSAYTTDCPPADCGPCGTLPPGFVRLRYFYGKRLGVVDFLDEQRYHAGKLRFHNQRLHGAGVLCGLGASIFEATTTVLRIGKGAALDACGREIVVGYDQCIDVAAWFARWSAEQLADDPAWTPPLDGDVLRLCVTLRFRECPAGIEPAPRDPCACDATGNDYGRVREEFALDLVPHGDAAAHLAPGLTPPRPGLDVALGAALGAGDLIERLRERLALGCPEAEPDGYLVIACVDVRFDADGNVASLDPPTAVAPILMSSALLEELLTRTMGATLEAGAWAAGAPEIDAIRLSDATADTVELALTAPILPGTLPPVAGFVVRELTASWGAAAAATSVSFAATPPVITIGFPAGTFAADRAYRLTVSAPADAPVVDAELRPLHPLRPSFHFRVIDDGGLIMAPAPYAEAAP